MLVALLRGLNVGKTGRVAMADLRALFERLGHREVRTLLNSGNVLFRPERRRRAASAASIEAAIAGELGVVTRVAVLAAEQVEAVVRENPLGATAGDPSRLLLAVPTRACDLARLAPLVARRWSPEALALGRRVAWLWCANGAARSPLWHEVEARLDGRVTARNLRTFERLVALGRRERAAAARRTR